MESEAGRGGRTTGEEDDGQQRQMTLLINDDDSNYFDDRVSSGRFVETIIEEIALEGLDGITFQALKIRLEQGHKCEINDFENIAPGIWSQLKQCKTIKFYLLPKPRADLVKYRWDESRDTRGHVVEQLHSPEEIYRYYPVEDKKLGIRGSCEYYHTRRDISQICRKSSYAQISNGLGNRLVIVASQYMREQILLGANNKKHKNLTIVQYCIVERIGRSRSYGEVTRGKISLTCLNISPKTLFYQRKHLLKSGLVTRQYASIKFLNNSCPATVTVLHLPRFYKRIESVVSVNTRTIFCWLNNSPTKSVPIKKIITKFGKRFLKDLPAQFPTLVQTTWEPHKVSPVESSSLEKMEETPTKNVRVLRLLVKDTSVQNKAISKAFDNQPHEVSGEDPENGEESEQIVSSSSAASYSDILALRPNQQLITSTNFFSLCHLLMRAGIGGLTILDIGNIMRLTPLESRACTRFLFRNNICKEGVVKLYKTKAFTYTLTNYALREVEISMSLQDKYEAAMVQMQQILQRVAEMRQRQQTNRFKSKRNNSSQRKPNVNDENTATHDGIPTGLKESLGRQSCQQSLAAAAAAQVFPLTDLQNESNQQQEVFRNEFDLACLKESAQTQVSDLIKKIISDERNKELSSNSLTKVHLVDVAVISASRSSDGEGDGAAGDRVQEEPKRNSKSRTMSSKLGSFQKRSTTAESWGPNGPNISKDIQSREDCVDKSIRLKATRQRVTWTPLEDRILFTAYIASCMFIPKYTLDKIFMYNSRDIRDIMLRKADGRSDKTSAAIRRRLQFLVRQKSHFDWYVQHVSLAVRDNELYENHVKDNLPPPQYKNYSSPSFEVLEPVVDYLLCKFNDTATTSVVVNNQFCNDDNDSNNVVTTSTCARPGLTGIDTLLFLRQLKRAEFYWMGLLFVIFCPMGDGTPQAKQKFISDWRILANNKKSHHIGDDFFTDLDVPVFDVEEVKEIQMQMNNEKDNPALSPQELYVNFCWKYLKFLTNQCNVMFNNILLLNSLPDKGFQIVSFFDRNMEKRSTNISLCLRECNSQSEVRLWTSRSLLLEQIFSGEEQDSKDHKNKDNISLERAARTLCCARVLIAPKGSNTLKLNRVHLKSFLEGLPPSSFGEMRDLLHYLDEECNRVDALACLSPGMLTGIVELSDYWNAHFTLIEPIFTVRNEWTPFSFSEELVGTVAVAVSSPKAGLGPPKKKSKPNPSETTSKKGKKRKQRTKGLSKTAKRRKTKKDDKIVNEVAECFEDLSVNGDDDDHSDHSPPPSLQGMKVGLEEGENYLCSSVNRTGTLNLSRIHSHPLFTGENGKVGRKSQVMDDNDVNINFPSLEFEFLKKTFALNHNIVGCSHPFALDALKELRQGLMELVYHHVSPVENPAPTQKTVTIPQLSKHLNKYSVLFDLISIAGVVGVSGAFLETEFERKSLVKGLRYLLNARLIFGVGVVHRRFVSFNNVNDWIIPIRPQLDSQVVGHVILRPWITAVGGISWTTISRLFTALIGQMQKPSIRLNELCQIFAPILSPVEALVLIESLAKLKYLILYKLQEPKVTLFSKHPIDKCDIEYNADTLIDTVNVFVAISPYITTLHAQLQHALQKTSKKKPVSI